MKFAGKLVSVFTSLAMALFLVPVAALAEPTQDDGPQDEDQAALTNELPASYMQVDLSAEGKLQLPEGCDLQVSTPEDPHANGILLSGTAAQFQTTPIAINQQFVFTDDCPVTMVALDGLAVAGEQGRVTASVILDDSHDALASFDMKSPTSHAGYATLGNLVQNVTGQVESGEHNASLLLQTNGIESTENVTVLLRSVEFMQSTFPILSLDLVTSPDELTDAQREDGYGTIDDMNSSADHSVRTTGTMGIQVPADYENEFGGSSGLAVTDLEYIRGRGNSTWDIYGKRPYRLKLDNKKNLLGMGKNKHWDCLQEKARETS